MSQHLKDLIQEDMKSAMRAKNKDALGTIRMLLAAIKQREIDEKITLADSDVTQVIQKMIKQRLESIKQYCAGNRNDLADKEQQEIDVLQKYLPEALSETEIDNIIDQVITQTGASSMRDIGKLMGQLKAQLQGRADMSLVSTKVKEKLN